MLIGYKTFSEFVTRAFSFLIVVIAVRVLITEEFGVFSLAWTAGWIISVSTDFGLQLFLAREVARNPGEAWSIFRHLVGIRVLVSGGVFAVIVGVCGLSGWPSYSWVFLALIAAQIGVSLIEFCNYFYRGLSRSELEASFNLIHRFLALTLTALLLWIYPTVMGLAVALILATVLTLAWSVRLCLRVGSEPFDGEKKWPAKPPSLRSLFHQVFPIGMGIVLSALYFRIDLFLIEWWKGTESVALYNAVFRLVESLRLFPAAVMAVVFPELCRDFSWRTLTWTCLGLFGLALGLAAILGRWSGLVVELLYGESYRQAIPTLNILLLALPLLFVNVALTHQLMAWNLQRFYVLLCMSALFCNLGLNWVLIPALSIVGAAWSTLGTEVLLTVGCIAILVWNGAREVTSQAVHDTPSLGSLR